MEQLACCMDLLHQQHLMLAYIPASFLQRPFMLGTSNMDESIVLAAGNMFKSVLI